MCCFPFRFDQLMRIYMRRATKTHAQRASPHTCPPTTRVQIEKFGAHSSAPMLNDMNDNQTTLISTHTSRETKIRFLWASRYRRESVTHLKRSHEFYFGPPIESSCILILPKCANDSERAKKIEFKWLAIYFMNVRIDFNQAAKQRLTRYGLVVFFFCDNDGSAAIDLCSFGKTKKYESKVKSIYTKFHMGIRRIWMERADTMGVALAVNRTMATQPAQKAFRRELVQFRRLFVSFNTFVSVSITALVCMEYTDWVKLRQLISPNCTPQINQKRPIGFPIILWKDSNAESNALSAPEFKESIECLDEACSATISVALNIWALH